MRGISAKSLDEVLAAVGAVTSGLGDLGGELFGVVAVLDQNPVLRRVLTDPSTESPARAGLAQQVFGPRVSPDAARIVEIAATGRWASGRDMSDGLELAGVTALVAAADAAGELSAVETELFEVGRLVRSDGELRQTVSDRALPVAAKTQLLVDLLGDKVTGTTLALTSQAVAARTGSFERALAAFAETAAARGNRLLAEVRVATALDAGEEERLAAALAAKYGRDIHLNIVIDPAVIGGITVSVAGEVVDGSMSTRLEIARRRLAG
ncbi:F0F1 ATP synthase subunit delta [Aeromicrobium sp. S22]|uniref:F0F1 ATP synthase subunit delta n=1 Tax=Aeromicrobium sp. S22 TaxID=2662029 RepID=UPI00129DE264|nr:F0F1 ATP synthase subunit delta [Aeromicrobium sp. S22]MRK01083.1 F0F1 ATP synthase subunit delta [Aeromicrobium sp. S22]